MRCAAPLRSRGSDMKVILSATGIVLLGILLSACQQPLRYEYSDARAAKNRYRECIRSNPGDPGACEQLRLAAGAEYDDYKRRNDERRGCDTSASRCER